MTNKYGINSNISRRTALIGLGATATALGMPRIANAKTDQIVMATGGGKLEEAYRKTVYEPWTAKTGVNVINTSNEGARLKAMVEQGNVEWDLIQGPAEALAVYAKEGLLEPIDYSVVDKDAMVKGSAHDHFVVTDLAAYNIAWNTDNVTGEGPQSWADLFALDGRVGLWKRPFQTMEAALLADGVPINELYPLDVDRAFASMDKIKDKLVWWEKGAQSAQLLLDGEVDAGSTWNGRVFGPKNDGAPVDYTFNQAILVSDGWGVPKGAPNKAEAFDMMAYALSPEAQAAFAKTIPYGPVNKNADALLDDAVKANLPTLNDNTVLLDVSYWADNSAEVVERFNTWILG
ncbi:ABC transporter substrate-binding protein [Hoeflea sp. WL0058]|uniref:ABC transporter substrate-binding protein n=1 Tax=Flavimaribacter sediminis TaxID=2865987 RepID=A0AAE2ZMQ6_9HYPH|nr:ABC transporter substrate-binding protein [Flavimaribacter sediminis]MBW8637515.1 ABC transporter substrate-binding protein [Flavimaribacter sediminis]